MADDGDDYVCDADLAKDKLSPPQVVACLLQHHYNGCMYELYGRRSEWVMSAGGYPATHPMLDTSVGSEAELRAVCIARFGGGVEATEEEEVDARLRSLVENYEVAKDMLNMLGNITHVLVRNLAKETGSDEATVKAALDEANPEASPEPEPDVVVVE